MHRFTSYIAFFLLLLFVRVLVPEAAILQLHHHEHTEHEAPSQTEDGLKVDQKHTHCQADPFFNHSFTSPSFVTFALAAGALVDTYTVQEGFAWKFTFPHNTELRGPPATA